MPKPGINKTIGYFLIGINYYFKYPRLLSVRTQYLKFCVPLSHINMKRMNNEAEERFDEKYKLIDEAIASNSITAVGEHLLSNNSPNGSIVNEIFSLQLNNYDSELLKAAFSVKAKEPDNQLFLGLENTCNEVVEFCNKHGFQIFPETDMKKMAKEGFYLDLSSDTNFSIKLYKHLIFKRYGILLILLYAFVILVFSKIMFFSNYPLAGRSIIETIAIQVTIIIVGLTIYLFRELHKAIYGIIEVLIGLFTINSVLLRTGIDLGNIKYDPVNMIAVLAGFYIIVRGADNIVKGSSNFKLFLTLKKVFGIGK